MVVVVSVPFRGCRDGERVVTQFKAGDVIEGDLARVALEEGWARKSLGRAPKNKALGGAPKGKFPGSKTLAR